MERDLLEKLFIFARVAEAHSFTLAGKRIGLSKSAVSTKVKSLERELGVQLLNRSTRTLSLTDAGRVLLEGVERTIVEADDAIANLTELARAPRGRLRVATSIGLSTGLLAPLVPAFLTRYPGITLELSASQDVVDLAANGFDVAVRMSDLIRETDISWPIRKVEWWPICSPSYSTSNNMPAKPTDLPTHQCLLYSWESGRNPAWQFAKNGLSDAVTIKSAFRANNAEALLQAAIAGGGIAILPDFLCGSLVSNGSLLRVLPEYSVRGRYAANIVAVRPWSPRVPPTVRAFVDFMMHAATLMGSTISEDNV